MSWDAVMLLIWKLFAVLVLVLLNGFFVAAEFALVKIRDTQLAPKIQQGHRRAKVAQLILGRLDSFLSAAQLGITLASLGLGWIGEPVFMALLQPVFGWLSIDSLSVQHALAFVIGMSAITFLHISAGEQAPKLLAIQKPLATTLWIAYPLLWFYRLSYPFVLLLNGASQWLLRRVGLEAVSESDRAYSEDELRLMLGAAKNSPDQRDLVLNALDLRQRTAREVMRPRQEITVFDSSAPVAECLALAEKTRYSRFPVCTEGNLDQMLGIVHIKDLYALRDKAQAAADLLPLARPLIYVPETARLDKLMRRFLDRRSHFAVVVDEFGSTVGIVTLENTIEALVGQIQDEFDAEATQFVRRSDDVWAVSGVMALHDLERIIGLVTHDENTTTASGWVTEKLGGFPRPGDFVNVNGFELRVEELDGTRVASLKVTRKN